MTRAPGSRHNVIRRPKSGAKNDPRLIALKILNALEQKQTVLDRLLEDTVQTIRFPHQRDRSLLNALVYGVLRHRNPVDGVIGRFSRIKVPRLDPDIRNILRIAVYQIFYLDRVPDSAAVNTAVEAAQSQGKPGLKAYINGVLRNVVRNKHDIELPSGRPGSPAEIALHESFPQWMADRWVERFGFDETVRLCRALNEIPPVSLRTNTIKTDRRRLAETAAHEAEKVELTKRSETGVNVFRLKTPLHEWKSFQDGWFQVQDEAAQLVGRLLDPKPGDLVLDLFAGMGGKTAHIADLMDNRGSITAVDKDARKLQKLKDEARRLGIQCVSETIALDIDIMEPLPDKALFDKILVDAPCSGLGVVKRNPDIKWNRDPSVFHTLGRRQRRFLEYASRYLKTGGVLVYAVCSLEPEESVEVIDSFLQDHPEYRIDTETAERIPCLKGLVDSSGFFRTFPHLSDMDGFFAVRLKKT